MTARFPLLLAAVPGWLAIVLSLIAASPVQGRGCRSDASRPPAPLEVRFTCGGVELAGLVRLPDGPPPHPAVVLLPGSLATTKEDERLAAVAAAFLVRGFAVLTTDSRGTGGSEGDFDTASLRVLADDAFAAITMLRQRPEVRASAVGLWGVSQGATWVGPLAAERAGAAFLVSVSGPLVSPEAFMHRFLAGRLRSSGDLEEEAIERIAEARRAIWSYYATGQGHDAASAALEALRDEPWFGSSGLPSAVRAPGELGGIPPLTRTFLEQKDFDPLAAIARLRSPLLAVYGAEDAQMPVEENAETLRALASLPGARITVEVMPGLDHDLRRESGEGKIADPEALAMMARWAAAQVGAP